MNYIIHNLNILFQHVYETYVEYSCEVDTFKSSFDI